MTAIQFPAALRRLSDSPLEWFCLLGGLFFVNHYAWFLDDAYIYFRYVDNLLFLGHGLVFNAGEYTEGFSSPFWTLLLIPMRGLRLDYWLLTRLIGASCFFLFWLLAVRIRRASEIDATAGPNLPLCFLSFNYAVACYFTSGIETPLVQLSAALYAYFTLRPRGRWLQLLLGITPLVRHEFLIPFALAWAYAFWKNRRLPAWMLGSCVASLGGWMLFRIVYYADLVPNTFYLKDTTNWSQGWRYLWDTVDSLALYAILPLLWGLGWLRRERLAATLAARLAMIAFALPVLLYVVRIGGDPRHYRYLAFPVCLLLFSTTGIAAAWLAPLAARARSRVGTSLSLATILLSFTLYPQQLGEHPLAGNVAHSPRWDINDAVVHRYHELLRQDPWALRGSDQLDRYREYRERGRTRAYPRRPVIGWWCASLYAEFDRRAIHGLGLTDAILARVDMPADRPAHKMGLIPLATQLAEIYQRTPSQPRRGYFRAAVEQGAAPAWVAENLDSIEILEAKIFNRHAFLENLRLATTRVGRIRPPVPESQFPAPSQPSQ
jgi:hypothetical protein